MAKAWVYQDDKQVKKHGTAKASWYVGWVDPEGRRKCKSCGRGSEGKRSAEKFREKVQSQLNAGTYDETAKKTWADFRREYEQRLDGTVDATTRRLTLEAMSNFQRLTSPAKMVGIKTQSVDDFIRKRKGEPGKKPRSTVSPATVNKELRHLRAVFHVAYEWKYVREVPRFRMLREPKKLVTFVAGEDFAAIYKACDQARLPKGLANGILAADWWRGLLVVAYMTGWRISELLALRWAEVDLNAGTAITRAEDNKGGGTTR